MNAGKSAIPADLMLRVPTLTEVLAVPSVHEEGDVPDLGEEGLDLPPAQTERPSISADSQRVNALMDTLAHQLNALVSSRLRDLLTPALQAALQQAVTRAVQEAAEATVEQVVEQFRGPLIQALQVQLREALEAQSPPTKTGVPTVGTADEQRPDAKGETRPGRIP